MKFSLFVLFFFCTSLHSHTLKRSLDSLINQLNNKLKNENCGYKSCNPGKPGFINVHLVPHTHDDVGWLSTVDGYYYDTVQYILDTVTNELDLDSKKKFIYVEVAFLYRWWSTLSNDRKNLVKKLVNDGRLEFILGGWSMNDEASTHYSSIIDQHTEGFLFLKETFGECGIPKIGWQIDPFGHSREQASLFAQFGFDGLFFARIDYQDYENRKKSKTLEHMWFASESLGDQASLFSGALYGMSYSPPPGYCFECGDAPVRDDPNLDDYNADYKLQKFLQDAIEQAKYFTTEHIIWTMGSDFHYSNARINYKNIDKLIHLVNNLQTNGSKVNAFYSSPSCYLFALNKANKTYTSKTDDFFPYAHREHTFWSGYFTSRPSLKGYERTSNNFLQICRQVATLSKGGDELKKKVTVLKHAMGVLQHHDAVSGTGKQHVTDNYSKLLSKGMASCQEVIQNSISILMTSKPSSLLMNFCDLANISSCEFTEKFDKFAVILYNPLPLQISDYVKLPLSSNNFRILDNNLKQVDSQILPISEVTKGIPERGLSKAKFDLHFPVNISALGFSTYFVEKTQKVSDRNEEQFDSQQKNLKAPIVAENEFLKLTFDSSTNLLTKIENKEKGINMDIRQSLKYYLSKPGDNYNGSRQASGAYIFRPDGGVKDFEGKVKLNVEKGPLVTEVRQMFGDWASQVIRVKKGARFFENEWTVGPLPHKDKIGREVISNYYTPLNTENVFYTDSNGREMIYRKKDFRPTWAFKNTEPVAGNYFPVNSRIYMEDPKNKVRLTILTDRSQGGGSIENGQLELMLHRRLFYDDALGVVEPLNETGVDGKGLIVRGTHHVILDKIEESTKSHRMLARQLFMAPVAGLVKVDGKFEDFVKNKKLQWSGLNEKVPQNIHILTLEYMDKKSILIRLEHFFEKNEHSTLSKPASLSLKNLFKPFTISSVEEFTLGANENLNNAIRLQWNVKNYGKTKTNMKDFVTPIEGTNFQVQLNPMQIRTFIVQIV